MNHFMHDKNWLSNFAGLGTIYLFILIGINAVLRHLPIFGIAFLILVPVLTFREIMRTKSKEELKFFWVKTFTMVPSTLLIIFLRWFHAGNSWSSIWPWVVVLLFALNILEAIVTDIFNKNYINVVAGLLLIVTIPGPSFLSISQDTVTQDVLYQASPFWIFCYSIWNLAFISNHRPLSSPIYIFVLLAAVIPGPFNAALWLQSRTFTLAAHLLIDLNIQEVTTKIRWNERHRESLKVPIKVLQWFSLLTLISYAISVLSG